MRTKLSSYLLNPREPDVEDVIFPTETTLTFFRILHGAFGSCRGQTIHQVLRDPCVLRKQLLYGLCKRVFNAVTVRQIVSEWKSHTALYPAPSHTEFEFMEYVDTWSCSLSGVIKSAVSAVIEEVLYHFLSEKEYGAYVDWLATVGVVPVAEQRDTLHREQERARFVSAAIHEYGSASALAEQMLRQTSEALRQVAKSLSCVNVPNCAEVSVRRSRKAETVRAFKHDKEIRVYVHSDPLAYEEGRLLYTTPIAHLFAEIVRYDALCRHRKVCQLLNTFPVKAITTSRHEMNNKRIVELMERHDKTTDAKKSIIKFLLNISDSKSRIGIEDSVESFIQDLTPSIVDQSRLMPLRNAAGGYGYGPAGINGSAAGVAQASADRDVRDLFRKQIIKCLEEQIETQMDEIKGLKMLNQAWEKKTDELKSIISRFGRGAHTTSRAVAERRDDYLNCAPVLDAVKQAHAVPFEPLAVDDNTLVANSFFSQFVPDTEGAEGALGTFWESEYLRFFKLRKVFTNQGTEESVSYSNYTIERVLTPFIKRVLSVPHLDPVPEECLFLSFSEVVDIALRESKAAQYIRFVCDRETARNRQKYQQQTQFLALRDPVSSQKVHAPLHIRDPDPRFHPYRGPHLTERSEWYAPRDRFSDDKLQRLRAGRNVQHNDDARGDGGVQR